MVIGVAGVHGSYIPVPKVEQSNTWECGSSQLLFKGVKLIMELRCNGMQQNQLKAVCKGGCLW